MTKALLLLTAVAFLTFSCKKDDEPPYEEQLAEIDLTSAENNLFSISTPMTNFSGQELTFINPTNLTLENGNMSFEYQVDAASTSEKRHIQLDLSGNTMNEFDFNSSISRGMIFHYGNIYSQSPTFWNGDSSLYIHDDNYSLQSSLNLDYPDQGFVFNKQMFGGNASTLLFDANQLYNGWGEYTKLDLNTGVCTGVGSIGTGGPGQFFSSVDDVYFHNGKYYFLESYRDIHVANDNLTFTNKFDIGSNLDGLNLSVEANVICVNDEYIFIAGPTGGDQKGIGVYSTVDYSYLGYIPRPSDVSYTFDMVCTGTTLYIFEGAGSFDDPCHISRYTIN